MYSRLATFLLLGLAVTQAAPIEDTQDDDFVIGHGILEEESLFSDYVKPTTTPPTTIRDHFVKTCANGFFACKNGECISPKWRCDGHYDCDDFSDELDCGTISKPVISKIIPEPERKKSPISSTTAKPAPPAEDYIEPKFNSSHEPLMLFSTGSSIRGYWMSSRIYFDVVSSPNSQIAKPDVSQPTITQALSIFFGMFNPDRQISNPSIKNDKPSSTIVGVDMDPDNKEVFWVELGKDAGVFSTTIDEDQFDVRHRRQYAGHKPIVEYGLLSPEDVALDTVGKNLYITDAGLPAIVSCSVKHSDCKIIAREGMHKPRAIIVDSNIGWLVYTDWGDHPGIFLVSMDGEHRETLIDTDVVWPNGLASDYATNNLYWADARLSKIEKIDLVSRKRRVIIKESISNPFSLSIFENRLYWSDWSGNHIKTCDKTSGNQTRTIMHAENIYGIHIYHPQIYQSSMSERNPCWSKRCSHLCLISPLKPSFADRKINMVGATCACPESMVLSSRDGTTCIPHELSFVLMSIKNYVAQMFPEHIGVDTIEKIVYSKNHVIHDVVADWHESRLFFFDASKNQIQLVTLPDYEAKRPAHVEVFRDVGPSTRSLEYDSAGGNLYWIDRDNGTITLCSAKTKFEVIIKQHLDEPTSLVLDYNNRVFYIAVSGKTGAKILRTDIHGKSDIVITDDVAMPISLHLDQHNQRLYWADPKRGTIESMDLDLLAIHGYKPESHQIRRHNVGLINGFTVYHDDLIWTVKGSNYLHKVRINDELDLLAHTVSEAQRPTLFKLPPQPSARAAVSDNIRISLVEPQHVPHADVCEDRQCMHACVLEASGHPICLCPDEQNGYRLTNATNSCPLPHEHLHASDMSPGFHVPIPQHHATGGHPLTDGKNSNSTTSAMHEHNMDSMHESRQAPAPQVALQTHTQPMQAELVSKMEPIHQASGNGQDKASGSGGTVWPLVLLILFSLAALAGVIGLLILHRQGRLPRQVSHLSVSFHHDKDGMLLLDDEA